MSERARSRKMSLQRGSGSRPAQILKMPPRPKKAKTIVPYIRWAHAACALVIKEYKKRSLKPKAKNKSADDLHEIIKEIYRSNYRGTISVYSLAKSEKYSKPFLGLTIRQKGVGQKIFLNPYQGKTSLRFALVQESFQALLDHKSLRSDNLGTDLGVYLVFRELREFAKAKGPTWGELIAEIAAMEAMFPYKDRQRILVRYNLGPEAKRSVVKQLISDIARAYGIPTRWVWFYLRDDIMEQLAQFHFKKRR